MVTETVAAEEAVDDTGETFAALLKRWSDAQGWTVNRLRLRMGLSFHLVRRWLDGVSIPGAIMVPGIARALELPEGTVRSAVDRSVRMATDSTKSVQV